MDITLDQGASIMSYVHNQKPITTQVPQAPIDVSQTTGAGPLVSQDATPTYNYQPRRVSMRSRLEKVGFWIIVAAAMTILLLLLGVLVPRFISGMFTAFFAGLFVSILALMNLPRPAGWGNALLGRRVFPVLRVPNSDIWRLAWVNGFLVFAFTFVFHVVASLIGSPLIGGIFVFAALIASAVFYNRVRSVVIKP